MSVWGAPRALVATQLLANSVVWLSRASQARERESVGRPDPAQPCKLVFPDPRLLRSVHNGSDPWLSMARSASGESLSEVGSESPLGALLGASWGPLGGLLGPLGRILDGFGSFLEASWRLLGPSWCLSGPLGRMLDGFWKDFGRLGAACWRFWPVWRPSRAPLPAQARRNARSDYNKKLKNCRFVLSHNSGSRSLSLSFS